LGLQIYNSSHPRLYRLWNVIKTFNPKTNLQDVLLIGHLAHNRELKSWA